MDAEMRPECSPVKDRGKDVDQRRCQGSCRQSSSKDDPILPTLPLNRLQEASDLLSLEWVITLCWASAGIK